MILLVNGEALQLNGLRTCPYCMSLVIHSLCTAVNLMRRRNYFSFHNFISFDKRCLQEIFFQVNTLSRSTTTHFPNQPGIFSTSLLSIIVKSYSLRNLLLYTINYSWLKSGFGRIRSLDLACLHYTKFHACFSKYSHF
jgi:hypothetical protein